MPTTSGFRDVFAESLDAEHVLFQHILFFFGGIVNVVVFELFLHIVVDFLINDDCLFGSADHAVVKCLGQGTIREIATNAIST